MRFLVIIEVAANMNLGPACLTSPLKPRLTALGQPLWMAAHASDWVDLLNGRRRGGKRNTMVSHNTMVETVESFKLHPTSILYKFKVFEHLLLWWMGI